jgi:hypothetical protein
MGKTNMVVRWSGGLSTTQNIRDDAAVRLCLSNFMKKKYMVWCEFLLVEK